MTQRPITPELFDALIDVIEHKINLRSRWGTVKSVGTEKKLEEIRRALFGPEQNPFSNPAYAEGFHEGYNARMAEEQDIEERYAREIPDLYYPYGYTGVDKNG